MFLFLSIYPVFITLVYLIYFNFLKYSSNISSKNEEYVFSVKNMNYFNFNCLLACFLVFYVLLYSNYNYHIFPYYNSTFPPSFCKYLLVCFMLLNSIFKKNFNFQFGASFIIIFFLFCVLFSDFLLIIIFFEVVFYMYLYTLVFSLMYSTNTLKSHYVSSLMFPLIILNFYST